jgi:tRNA pseudouridine55 synthase
MACLLIDWLHCAHFGKGLVLTAAQPALHINLKRLSLDLNVMNGLLVIDKPAGITSHDVVDRLRRITGERSIGHLGTLDPLATGVLPLLLGKFTRLAQYFSTAEKSYTGLIRFGFATDTWDAEGQPAGTDLWPEFSGSVTLDGIRCVASRYHGELEQMPPPFSAKKIEGKPAYKLARAGKPVELKPAKINIAAFEITALEGPEASFAMSISAGGYVRSVAHELGQTLGCGAHLTQLRRTRAGAFTLDDAHALDELEELRGNLEANDVHAIEDLCVHPRILLPHMPAVTADAAAMGRLRNGAQANLAEFSQAPLVKVFASQWELVGIAKRIAGTLFQPVAVF